MEYKMDLWTTKKIPRYLHHRELSFWRGLLGRNISFRIIPYKYLRNFGMICGVVFISECWDVRIELLISDGGVPNYIYSSRMVEARLEEDTSESIIWRLKNE